MNAINKGMWPILRFFSLVPVLVQLSTAQFSYDGCADLTANDFNVEYLVQNTNGDIEEPIKMDFDMHSVDNIDIYFVERHGKLRMLSGSTGQVTTLHDIADVFSGGSGNNDGLVGIALDPDFKNNGWIYMQRSLESPSVWRLSRYKITDGNFDINSELVIADIPSKRAFWHTGGDLAFDDYGDLWWATGDNTTYTGPANTNDLRGKILRITPIAVPDGQSPEPGAGTTYNIPEGNLFPEADDTDDLTRPEIFIMGTRNPYTIGIDPVRRWVSWGEVGPDAPFASEGPTEEHNLFTTPGNAGWPFFAGENLTMVGQGGRYDADLKAKDPDNIVLDPDNNADDAAFVDKWFNQDDDLPIPAGLFNLPPAMPATWPYNKACGLSGPIHRYNPDLESDVKMPPHFDRVWFASDCNNNHIYAFDLNDDGTLNSDRIDLTNNIFNDVNTARHLDFETGPDGALYLLKYDGNYSSGDRAGIMKISYTGDCTPAYPDHPRMEKAGCMNEAAANYDPLATHDYGCEGVPVSHQTLSDIPGLEIHRDFSVKVTGQAGHSFDVTDVRGKSVYAESASGPASYRLNHLRTGLYFVRLQASGVSLSRKLVVH